MTCGCSGGDEARQSDSNAHSDRRRGHYRARPGTSQQHGRGGLMAAENYREAQREHLNTAELCASRGIAYESMVFTKQAGRHRAIWRSIA